jgi:hypothetical protein
MKWRARLKSGTTSWLPLWRSVGRLNPARAHELARRAARIPDHVSLGRVPLGEWEESPEGTLMDSTPAVAQEIVVLLRERPDRAEREDRLGEEIALGDQWSEAECSE